MIARLSDSLFRLQYDYTNPIERQRARALLIALWAVLPIWFGLYIFAVIPLVRTGEIPPTGFLFISMTLVPGPLALIFFTLQRGQLRAASLLVVGSLLALNVPLGLVSHIDLLQMMPIIALVAGGVLLDRRSLLVVTVICLISIVMTTIYQGTITEVQRFVPADTSITEGIAMAGVIALIAAFLYAFSGTPERVASDANRVADRWAALSAMTRESFPNDAAVIERAMSLTQDPLGYEIVQVFLRDTPDQPARRYRRLPSGSLAPVDVTASLAVDYVLRTGETLRLTTRDPRAAAHLVQPAQSALLLPIAYEGIRLGVFDVQSRSVISLDERQLPLLVGLTDQIGRALVQSRRVAILSDDVRGQEAQSQRLRSQVAELQRRTEGSAASGWDRYLRGFGAVGFGYDMEGTGRSLVAANDLPMAVRESLEQGEVHVQRHADSQTISAPIAYRGQMLGAMTFALPLDRTIGDSELEIVSNIAGRLGIALENNRLFEQSQSQAQRERKASEIGGLLLSATDVEQVLTLAAEAFNDALGATHTRVSLRPDQLERALNDSVNGGGAT